MRTWGWALVLVGVAVIGTAVVVSSQEHYTSPWPAPAMHRPLPPAVHQPAAAQATTQQQPSRHFRPLYQQHRDQVVRVSGYSQRARTNRVVAAICFLMFALVTLPKNSRDVRAFYYQLVATRPLPAEAGEDDENNRRARQVLFFYLLFLLYQVVQFPLTWGRDNAVQFYSDLVFQFLLLTGVVVTFWQLKRGVAEHFADDPGAPIRMEGWLGTKLEGLTVRWRDVSRLALLMFVGGFTPALLAKLPDWLDVIASY